VVATGGAGTVDRMCCSDNSVPGGSDDANCRCNPGFSLDPSKADCVS